MAVTENGKDLELGNIEDLWIGLRAELDHKTVTFSELLDLEVGSILQLGRATGENIDLYAGHVRLGSGEILIVESSLAVRLADVSDGSPENEKPVE
jgi:flagellar motor switch protein FliN/FliY